MNRQEKTSEEQLSTLREEHAHLLADYLSESNASRQAEYHRILKENESKSAGIQEQLNKKYQSEAKVAVPRPPVMRNVWRAFLVGGTICTAGQIVILLMQGLYDMEFRSASAMASVTVVIVTAVLTGIGIYDEIGRFGGAGSMVPISGFSNSIVSAALEWKSSGMIYGIGAKIFTIAGPVILYGTMASVFLGLVYYILQ